MLPGVKINFALAYGEFELYGRGFAGQTRYVSHVQDLGQPATLGRVFMAVSKWRRQGAGWSETADGERRWQVGELVEAPDAEVDVVFRLKNGTDADPLTYFTWNDLGELAEIERTAWEALKLRTNDSDPSFVGWRGARHRGSRRVDALVWRGESIWHAPRPAQPPVLPVRGANDDGQLGRNGAGGFAVH